jgi:amino acid adenylation domain-containing protein/thioester reductase-like protein
VRGFSSRFLEIFPGKSSKSSLEFPLDMGCSQAYPYRQANQSMTFAQFSPGSGNFQAVHHLIESQAHRTPQSVAIVFEQQQISYGQLNHRANQLAHHLRHLGVAPGVLVGLCVERSIEMFIALLGVLKAGGTYIPLDPAYPSDRLEFMLADSQSAVLLTHGNLDVALNTSSDLQRVYLDRDAATIAQYSEENLDVELTGDDRAYIIYTSGSTGKPKGVQITHSNMLNFLVSMAQEPGLTSQDTLLAVTTVSFDIAVLEIFLPLMLGARVVLASRAVATDPSKLVELLESSQANCMQATPATWRMLIATKWQGNSSLKILCGGEALNRSLADQLLQRCGSLWNMYGPTETTVWSMVCQVQANHQAITLGHPIANTQIYIIPNTPADGVLEEIIEGESGELYIGGMGVAQGYLNRPKLNREKFIPDPSNSKNSAKLYRTGDLARYLPSGEIEIIGRADNQVKVRGHRIELGEIEAVLSEHPDVHESAVIAPEDSTGNRRLLAYVVAKPNTSITSITIRQWLAEKLPAHMIPNMVMLMDALPLTPNCKIDRRALPIPSLALQEEIISPRTDLEAKLVQLWSEVLGIEVGISQNFHECGGDSLRTSLLLSRIHESFGIQVPLECLFKAPTVEEFAKILQRIQTFIASLAFQMTTKQLQVEAELPADILPSKVIKPNRHQLFLTGASGFIGAFLLQDLLVKYPTACVYCLVRADNISEASDRLRSTMKCYEIWEDSFGERIIPILGDLEKPRFGLDEQQFCNLANHIDVIYHSGAYVNLVYPYSALRSANVGGTLEVLRLATLVQTIPLHYISTIDVFHSQHYNGHAPILESDELISAEGYFEGYAQTKWVAEKLVMAARDRGLPTVIYRLGMITGHSQTGGSQLGNLICRMIKGFIQLGNAPDLDMGMVLAPVDYVVAAIAALSHNPEAIGKTFHIVSPHRLPFRQFIADINALGYPVELLPYETWCQQLSKLASDNALKPAASMFSYSDRYEGTPIETGTFVAQTHDTQLMQQYLLPHQIDCPPLTEKVVRAYVNYFIRQKFLNLSSSSTIAVV